MNYKLFAESIVENRPDIIAAYGYGSAFVHQSGYSYNTKKSLDLIFVVDDIKKWNNKNFKVNRDDYTKYSKTIFKLTPKHLLKSGTGIIYNVITNKYELDFKYGLIEPKNFIDDLYNWKHFYISGRFQKPVYTIKSNDIFDNAIKFNRKISLLAALIILNKEFLTIDELLEQICKLSYEGDIRNLFVENPNKVHNIVKGSLEALKEIYCNNEYLTVIDNYVYVDLSKVYEDSRFLPRAFTKKFNGNYDEYGHMIGKTFIKKNLKESIEHPVKQLYVSGLSTCKTYLNEKIKKKNIK